ncbi:glycoside hydrolase superfamily [Obelidium mucronatum]|nr:glycoside hydrolase superfamily [Obelidium mucronatum]
MAAYHPPSSERELFLSATTASAPTSKHNYYSPNAHSSASSSSMSASSSAAYSPVQYHQQYSHESPRGLPNSIQPLQQQQQQQVQQPIMIVQHPPAMQSAVTPQPMEYPEYHQQPTHETLRRMLGDFKDPPALKPKTNASRKCRLVSAIIGGILLLGVAVFLAVHFILLNKPLVIPTIKPITPTFDNMPNLVISGNQILYPNGTAYSGRGVNMGSWFIMDAIYSGFVGLEEFEFFTVTDQRWNQQTSYQLMNTYIDNAITPADYDLLGFLGFNFIRLPLHFRNFQDAQGNWILNSQGEVDFRRLDWAIANMTAKGFYVQLDFHVWYGRETYYGGVSDADPTLPAEVAATYQKWRDMGAEFLTVLTSHVKNVPGIMAIELANEPVPSYGNTLSVQWYNAVRSADPDRIIVRHFGVDRADPLQYNWTNMIYGFHTYETAATLSEFQKNSLDKCSDRFNVPYYLSELQFVDYRDFAPAIKWAQGPTLGVNLPLWALWTYKAVDFNGWALVNWDKNYQVDLRKDSLERINQVWKSMPGLDLGGSLSQWGKSFLQ